MWPFKKKSLFPSSDWVKKNIPSPQTENLTPDFLWLEKHPFCLLFVYDEMMLNRRQYKLIGEDSVNMGHALTADRNWTLWKKRLGEETFPIPLLGEAAKGIKTAPGIGLGRIKGELHAVRPHLFWEKLDSQYLNGVEFKRERVKLLRPYHLQQDGGTMDCNEFVASTRAWMYVGINDYWVPQLDAGYAYQPVGMYSPRVKWVDGHEMGNYYSYTRLEDETNF